MDIGGTFTDVIVLGTDGSLEEAKAATTPHDRAIGVIDAIVAAADGMGMTVGSLLARSAFVKHGSTVATNALITRAGVRVGLITTRGFEDTTTIMRAVGRVDGLPPEEVRHVAAVTKPEPLVSADLVRGVRERIDAYGRVIVPLVEDDVRHALDELVGEQRVEAIAVSLLHAWRNPVHEQRIREIVETRYPDRELYVAYGAQLSGVAGEYARTNTAVADAFVGPIVRTYLADLDGRLQSLGLHGRLLIMQGNGGLAARAGATPISTLQSGPAGGMLAAAHMSAALGHRRVITTDMGGTSFDVGILDEGRWRYAEEPIFDRFRILQPVMDIVSIGAGGGTMARVEPATKRLLVGPESAGAAPGPVAYGAGGDTPTVTDADLVLGYLDPGYFLGGRRSLDVEAARGAIAACISEPLGMDVVDAAAGIKRIIDSKMSDLIRREVVRSGYLPSAFVLYAFGGAGPVHACGFAADLDVGEIHVFPTSAAFSAFGIAMADLIRTRVATREYALPIEAESINADLAALERELAAELRADGLGSEPVFRRSVTMRFRRQTTGEEVALPWDRLTDARLAELVTLFVQRYEELYGAGTAYVDAGIDINAIRVDAVSEVAKPELRPEPPAADTDASVARKAIRPAWFDGAMVETPVFEHDRLPVGSRLNGPAIVESPFTTIVVPTRWEAAVDPYRALVLRR
ncbi:MAG: hydantoinase/oxoprolinase family protein [Chloroflexota bacterium]